jgi:hypothetical protein
MGPELVKTFTSLPSNGARAGNDDDGCDQPMRTSRTIDRDLVAPDGGTVHLTSAADAPATRGWIVC